MIQLGWHWMAHADGCAPEALADPEKVRGYLDHLATALALRIVAPPSVERLGPQQVAGVVLLAQSHASVHTQADEGRLFADLFSCTPFEPQQADDVLRRWFCPASLDTRIVERGATP